MKKCLPCKNIPGKYSFLWGFFAFTSLLVNGQNVDFGKSYINISKGANGGTMEPGDTLQVRATFVVRSGVYDSCAFYDNIPAGTVYIPGSLAVITNEGKIYKPFTDAPADDPGYIIGTAVTINLGFNGGNAPATAFRRGRIRNTFRPSFYGSTCITVATYKVRIAAGYGSKINMGGGSVTYKVSGSAGAPSSYVFPVDSMAVFNNYGLCSNSVGANALGTEFNGTFGSGKLKDRGPSANVPASYTYSQFTSNMPNDYYYGISNNTSTSGAGYSTSNAWLFPDPSSPSHRVFSVWDIIGDHTGAVNPILGNPPADTVVNNNGGYMLVINASYRIDSAFKQTITGLCPNTYYEFSLWVRNICSKCGCDSTGKGPGTAGYIPTGPGDSSGVRPNLTFAIDNVDYYTTGDIPHDDKWVKKGFTYLTGPTQTSFTAMVRNNAPGGGGNDWAIDDISLATCTPNLNLIPSGGVNVCYGNQVDMSTTVRCFFPNYIYWTWERSTNGGASWFNTGVGGIGTPALVSGEWQYFANYPSFLADSSVHNNMFRIRVASTPSNLNNPGCSFTASNTIIVWVNNCSEVLKTKLLSFNGQLQGQTAQLRWTAENEDSGLVYEVERSEDGTHFYKSGMMAGGSGSYYFPDPKPVAEVSYFRLKLSAIQGNTYSKIITLQYKLLFGVKSLNNPFTDQIRFNLLTPESNSASLSLFDNTGRQVLKRELQVQEGLNNISLEGLGHLSAGLYTLQVRSGPRMISKKVIKSNQ